MARRRQESPTTSATIVTAGSVHDPDSLWREFRNYRADWIAEVGSPDPVYCLPEAVIACLEQSQNDRRPIMNTVAVQAERHLLDICSRVQAVGFWQDRPITFPYLSPPASRSGINEILQTLSPADRRQYVFLLNRLDEISPRHSGYVGWLLTEPTYCNEVQLLKERWYHLRSSERPSFPLERPIQWPEIPEGGSPASEALVRFASELKAFLDRWGLMRLATWDLPFPQGPLVPNLLPHGAPALPKHGIHIFVPLHHPLQGDDDIQREILRLQQQVAQELGLDVSMAGLPHFTAYSQILRVIHLDRIIVERYGREPREKGFMIRLEEAIAANLGCGLANVKKMRKAISLCRRGRRAEVKWLKPPVR